MNNWREILAETRGSPIQQEWLSSGNLVELNKHALKALKPDDALVVTELDRLAKSVRALKQEQVKKPKKPIRQDGNQIKV